MQHGCQIGSGSCDIPLNAPLFSQMLFCQIFSNGRRSRLSFVDFDAIAVFRAGMYCHTFVVLM
jgi:hypothetical protein